MSRHTSIVLTVVFALAEPAHAEEAQRQPDINVTASRVAETVDATLASVGVITRANIERSGAGEVVDLLRLQPGIDIARGGGSGAQTSVFLRGGNSNHALVLIDGVRVGSIGAGSFAFEQLPLDAVERIEIVRGPRASYWGSDAIGGVIQIFTRRLESPRVALRYGSYADASGSAGIGQWNGDAGFSVQAGLRHVRGFSATNPGVCAGPDDPYCIHHPDDDGYRNKNLSAQGAVRIGMQRLSASVLRSDAESEFDQGRSVTIEQAASVNLEGDLSDNWTHRLSIGDAREDLRTPEFFTLFLTRRSSLTWQNTLRLDASQRLIAGIDFVHEKGRNIDTFSGLPTYGDTRDNSAAFAGWQVGSDEWNGELSGRFDSNSEFGTHASGSAAIGVDVNDAFRLTASYGTAFRGPNLNEQFSPGFGGYFAGHPDLDPEASRTAEIGAEWRPDAAQHTSLRAFTTRVSDLISFTGERNRAENVARARIDGVELSYALKAGSWVLDANYTWQDPRNETDGTQLLRRAKQKFTARLDRDFSDTWNVGLETGWTGERADVGATLPGYALINTHVSWRPTPNWRLTLRAENLGDRDYELIDGYNTPGRSGWLEITWQLH